MSLFRVSKLRLTCARGAPDEQHGWCLHAPPDVARWQSGSWHTSNWPWPPICVGFVCAAYSLQENNSYITFSCSLSCKPPHPPPKKKRHSALQFASQLILNFFLSWRGLFELNKSLKNTVENQTVLLSTVTWKLSAFCICSLNAMLLTSSLLSLLLLTKYSM